MNIVDEAQKFFQKAFTIESGKKLLAEGRKKILFRNSDGPSFVVDFAGDSISVSEGETKDIDLGVESTSESYSKIFRGILSPGTAYHNRSLYFDGIPYKGYPWLTHLIKLIQVEGEK